MKLIIQITMDNAAFFAFSDNRQVDGFEVGRILRLMAEDVEASGPKDIRPPRDYNGNSVGKVTVVE